MLCTHNTVYAIAEIKHEESTNIDRTIMCCTFHRKRQDSTKIVFLIDRHAKLNKTMKIWYIISHFHLTNKIKFIFAKQITNICIQNIQLSFNSPDAKFVRSAHYNLMKWENKIKLPVFCKWSSCNCLSNMYFFART